MTQSSCGHVNDGAGSQTSSKTVPKGAGGMLHRPWFCPWCRIGLVVCISVDPSECVGTTHQLAVSSISVSSVSWAKKLTISVLASAGLHSAMRKNTKTTNIDIIPQ